MGTMRYEPGKTRRMLRWRNPFDGQMVKPVGLNVPMKFLSMPVDSSGKS